MRLRNFYCGPI